MTEPDEDGDDDRRELARRLFDPSNSPPADVVPGSGLTREVLLAQNAATGTWQKVRIPGEVILDVDGNPIGMEPSREESVCFGGTVVTRSQLEKLGLTPDDVPNVKVMDDPTPKEKR